MPARSYHEPELRHNRNGPKEKARHPKRVIDGTCVHVGVKDCRQKNAYEYHGDHGEAVLFGLVCVLLFDEGLVKNPQGCDNSADIYALIEPVLRGRGELRKECKLIMKAITTHPEEI